MTKFLIFMVIWMIGCAFVDYVIPDVANAWKMAFGAFTAFAAITISGSIQ